LCGQGSVVGVQAQHDGLRKCRGRILYVECVTRSHEYKATHFRAALNSLSNLLK